MITPTNINHKAQPRSAAATLWLSLGNRTMGMVGMTRKKGEAAMQ
ncbi:hypothetical protein [Microseira sp. BLCC-F43]